jgi:hypothetical protein
MASQEEGDVILDWRELLLEIVFFMIVRMSEQVPWISSPPKPHLEF